MPASSTTPATDVITQTRAVLSELTQPCWVIRDGDDIRVTSDEAVAARSTVVSAVGPLTPDRLGDRSFQHFHGVRNGYMAGAMANGIASPELVAALATAGYLASYGAAGVVPAKVDAALAELSSKLSDTPFACNVIHSPSEPALERAIVDACLRHRVSCIEASAFMSITAELVRYRVLGLTSAPDGGVVRGHRVVAKVSRLEVAEAFLRPAPAVLLRKLMESGDISADAAHLAAMVPMADDITVEADSGGHTDRRPLLVALPEIMALRDRIAGEFPAAADVRIGAAGGIGTPAAAAAAFGLGAAYVVTGSINQASVEAGTSAATKELLATAGSADCVMAPSSDMFEMGVQVQVLRRGTMFAGRAAQLYDVYRAYESIDAIPQKVREGLERDIFRRPLQSVWDECVRYFNERDPDQIAAADNNPRRRMALVLRWYLGLSSGWSINGDDTRTADYQVWCGPAMGAFNSWAAGTHLASARNRRAVDIADHIMTGAAFHTRINSLRSAGVHFPPQCATYWPSL